MFIREDSGDIAVLRLAYQKVSALDAELCEALVVEIASIAAGPSTALVITGTGSAFSAGVDLFKVLNGGEPYLSALPASAGSISPDAADVSEASGSRGQRSRHCRRMHHRLPPAITGSWRRAPARIGIPELIVGVPFPALPIEIVGARVPAGVFRQLVLTGRTVKAGEARELGLVDEVVEPDALVPRACEVAERFARIPAASFALTKRGFTDPLLDRVRAAADRDADVCRGQSGRASPFAVHQAEIGGCQMPRRADDWPRRGNAL